MLENTTRIDDVCPLPELALAEDLDLDTLQQRRQLETQLSVAAPADLAKQAFRLGCLGLEQALHPEVSDEEARKLFGQAKAQFSRVSDTTGAQFTTIFDSRLLEKQLPRFQARRREADLGRKKTRAMRQDLGHLCSQALGIRRYEYRTPCLNKIVPILLQEREEVVVYGATFRESGNGREAEERLAYPHSSYAISNGVKAPVRSRRNDRNHPQDARVNLHFENIILGAVEQIDPSLQDQYKKSGQLVQEVTSWLAAEAKGKIPPDHAVRVLDAMSAQVYHQFSAV
jgi:hypothetical protein